MTNKTNFPLNKEKLSNSYNFLVKLTNQIGIIQHTKYGVQDRKNGYSLDDNARAIIVCLQWYKQTKSKKALDLVATYLAWLFHAKTDEGFFYNFSSFDNQFKEVFSEDGFGRAFWSLGQAYQAKARNDITSTAKTLIDEIKGNLDTLISPRAIAYCILGLVSLAEAEKKNPEWSSYLEKLTRKLVNSYKKTESKDWHWFEEIIAYSNHLLPLSLFEAYLILEKKEFLEIATKSLEFLEINSALDGFPSPVGNHGWLKKGQERAVFDQQSIEASEAVLCFLSAYRVSKEIGYLEKALSWFNWYHGNNIKKLSLINKQTGGCFDSLMSQGVNENQGAESIIAYLMAALALLDLKKNQEKTLLSQSLILSS
ncbi:MAG: glycosyltransferase [bacterium]|nr:glycosyltransferase [bacterium]